ncbi:hypothetical protein HXX76_014937 [Chlamydomonas incerta]|uniref:Uncharacterized protein n=1 Tax=Chlamydomonas incerta TaxID=51695 RepID=A0A835VS64_CHLIN|nr:hypothetical protein HXX76_014937 [Chlamydomonas incerta]|eukprot:KAG2423883.1 hypothetical protein HXX76_014937 [Chlamydomonas incerta]
MNWLGARWLLSDSASSAHVSVGTPAPLATSVVEQERAERHAAATCRAGSRRQSAELEADCDSGQLSTLSSASSAFERSSASSTSSSRANSGSVLIIEPADLQPADSAPPCFRGTDGGSSCVLANGIKGGLELNSGCSATGPAGPPPPPPLHVAFQLPPPVVPPQLQPELDLLIDFLGLAGAVYGARLPHLSYGTPLPYLLAAYGARPLFSYRSSPAALVLDGSGLRLHARGYAHASALLEPAAPPAAGTGGAGLAFPGSKLLWKLRISRAGGSSGGCRADTSLGVLVVHVAGEPATAGADSGSSSSSSSGCSSGSGMPVISASVAAAWAGPLPLLAAAGGLGGGSGGGGHRRACSTLHAPGFFGWHMAGLARSYEPGSGGSGAAAAGGGGSGGCGILTKLQLNQAPSPFAAGTCATSSGAAEGRAANPLGGSTGRGALGPHTGSSATDGGSGCSREALPGMFFEEGDVLLLALDSQARRLEMHHGRLGQTFSVALPPPPQPSAVAAAGAAAAGGTATACELLYAHVCLYDQGEGVEVLEVGVEDLQRMGCV